MASRFFILTFFVPQCIQQIIQVSTFTLQIADKSPNWKWVTVIFIPNVYKSLHPYSSYFEMSVLCQGGGVLVIIVYLKINHHLCVQLGRVPLIFFHHVTLLQLPRKVEPGSNKQKTIHRIVVNIKLSRDFDTVDHTLLL